MTTEITEHPHWTKYPAEEIRYVNKHRFGPGCVRVKNAAELDWWLDLELAVPQQKKTYNAWLRANRYQELEEN